VARRAQVGVQVCLCKRFKVALARANATKQPHKMQLLARGAHGLHALPLAGLGRRHVTASWWGTEALLASASLEKWRRRGNAKTFRTALLQIARGITGPNGVFARSCVEGANRLGVETLPRHPSITERLVSLWQERKRKLAICRSARLTWDLHMWMRRLDRASMACGTSGHSGGHAAPAAWGASNTATELSSNSRTLAASRSTALSVSTRAATL